MKVVGHAPGRRHLLLSLRQAEQHPLDQIDPATLVGNRYYGVVAAVLHFGAFVRLPIGVDGLLHRSLMPTGVLLSEGDRVAVRVLSADRATRRIALCRPE